MVTRMRHTMLMLVALLGVIDPPNRPPGHPPPKVASRPATVPATGSCPYPGCPGGGNWRKELVYLCVACKRKFYYCLVCLSCYRPDQEGEHEHPSPAV
jgi:hypothetical protein